MPGTTPKRALPYPTNGDVPDIAGDIQDLATAVDTNFGSRGKCIIATEESRTNGAYGTLTTPDQVTGVVLPTDGLLIVAYMASWKESVANAARANIFLGSNELLIVNGSLGSPNNSTAGALGSGFSPNTYKPLASSAVGLQGAEETNSAYTGDVTTGQVLGAPNNDVPGAGGPCYIFAAAGTYTVSVRFLASTGSVTAKNRKLWVWTLPF